MQLRCVKPVLVSHKLGKEIARLIYNSNSTVISWQVKTLKAQNLQWLPTAHSADFKLLGLVFKALHNVATAHLSNLIFLAQSLGKPSPSLLPTHVSWFFLASMHLSALLPWTALYVHDICLYT